MGKVFEIQLKRPNHPTGSRLRDGQVFKVGQKYYAEKISKKVAADEELKISLIEKTKEMTVQKSFGTEPFVVPVPEEKKKTDEEAIETLKSVGVNPSVVPAPEEKKKTDEEAKEK